MKKPMFTDCFANSVMRAHRTASQGSGKSTLKTIIQFMPAKFHSACGSQLKAVAIRSGHVPGLNLCTGKSGGIFSDAQMAARKRRAKAHVKVKAVIKTIKQLKKNELVSVDVQQLSEAVNRVTQNKTLRPAALGALF